VMCAPVAWGYKSPYFCCSLRITRWMVVSWGRACFAEGGSADVPVLYLVRSYRLATVVPLFPTIRFSCTPLTAEIINGAVVAIQVEG